MRRKKLFAYMLTLALTAQSLLGNGIVAQAEENTVTHIQLSDNGTEAPASWGVTPSPNQYKYQKDELAAFCHFGMNTFTGSEWGSGTESPSYFTLTEDFDAETLVKSLYDAGFKKLIVTAKHHDGFCIWRSAYTDHDLESTNYSGDVLAEISAACTKYDMDMGLYLSPWDVNAPSYGYRDANGNATSKENDVLDYNEYYNHQLIEILGSDKYGNDGHFVEVWMDGAKGDGSMAQDYEFTTWFETIQAYEGKAGGYEDDCMLFGAEGYTSVHWIGNELGFANEETWAKVNTDKEANTLDANIQGSYRVGYPDGNTWSVPESDARITSGWFWGINKNTPKTVAELGEMYFRSVGHNSPLLLNVPPNSSGTIDQAILDRLDEFGDTIKATFANNYASEAAVSASSVRGNDVKFSPNNVLDGDDSTYWAPDGDVTTGTLELDLGGQKTFDVVSIEEAIELGQRISGFSVEYQLNGGEWKTFDEGTTIGAKRLCRKTAVKADKIRINITSSYALPLINEVGVYRAAGEFALGNGIPEGLENIDNTDKNLTDGAGFTYNGWTQETGDQYMNGTNMWANAGYETTVTFTGTKAWIIGTKDPNHGTADIYIDGVKQATGMSTNQASRQVGQVIYETPDLSDASHTLRIVNTNKAIGIEGALVLNNGGKGMLELEFDQYTVPEDTVNSFKVKRVGGSNGEISVTFEDNPGSAVQSEFLPTNGILLTFADGETEKTAQVTTKRQSLETGDLFFYIGLVNPTDDAIVGFNSTAKVTITDADAEVTPPEVNKDLYSEDNRFEFPTAVGEVKVLEAEYFQLHNTGENEQWPLKVAEASWASNGKFVDSLNQNDTITLYYTAEQAGVYEAVVSYRSGDPNNALSWAEASDKISAGTESVGAGDGAAATHTATVQFVVEETGNGTLVFTGPAKKSPQLDKFEITLLSPVTMKEALENKMAEAAELVQGDYTAESWSVFEAAYNRAIELLSDTEATQSEVNAAVTALTEAMEGLRNINGPALTPGEDYPAEDMILTAGSTQTAGSESLVVDNDPSTFWETRWSTQTDDDNYGKLWFQVELKEEAPINQLKYYPRYQGTDLVNGDQNGFISEYLVEVSTDGTNWTTVAEGNWSPVNDWLTADFDTVSAKYVRLTGVETLNNGNATTTDMSVAELRVVVAEGTTPPPAECEHTNTEVLQPIAATCTEAGMTAGVKCSDCGITIVYQEEVPATGHTEVVEEAVAATCTEAGKTEGKHCSVCNTVIKTQEAVPAIGHTWSDWNVTKEATVKEEGSKERTCSACDAKQVVVIPKLEDTIQPSTPSQPSTSTSTSTSTPAAPATGDSAQILMWIAAAFVIAAVGFTVRKKSR